MCTRQLILIAALLNKRLINSPFLSPTYAAGEPSTLAMVPSMIEASYRDYFEQSWKSYAIFAISPIFHLQRVNYWEI